MNHSGVLFRCQMMKLAVIPMETVLSVKNLLRSPSMRRNDWKILIQLTLSELDILVLYYADN